MDSSVQGSPMTFHPTPPSISVGYAMNQLQAALAAATRAAAASSDSTPPKHHTSAGVDPSPTAAADAGAARVRKWEDVITGIRAGTISVGSRAPVEGLPAWVTPEVARGGFATGRSAAGGQLQPHEQELAQRVNIPATREAIAAYYVSDNGLEELNRMLDTGGYKVSVPEEAALLACAWLLHRGAHNELLDLLVQLRPFFGTLRFAPEPTATNVTQGVVAQSGAEAEGAAADLVATLPLSRVSATHACRALQAVSPNKLLAKQHEAVTVWAPYFDSVLQLWLEGLTETGEVPRRLKAGWLERAAGLAAKYQVLAARHTACRKHAQPQRNTAVLRLALAQAVVSHGVLRDGSRKQVAHRIRDMLRKRGRPGTVEFQARRDRQAATVRKPQHAALAALLAARVRALSLPEDRGIPHSALQDLGKPVTAAEAAAEGATHPAGSLPEGSEIPKSVTGRLSRCLEAPLPQLLQQGTVPSAEALAGLVPEVAAAAVAAQYPDVALAQLMSKVNVAFTHRRSLLLLNLQSQVKVTELPWHAAMSHFAEPQRAAAVTAKAMQRLAEECLQAFPETVLPNPLVRELAALAHSAAAAGQGPRAPLLEELAADIFEHAFTAKFAVAAFTAAELLRGSLYERYYATSYDQLLMVVPEPEGRGPSEPFYKLCEQLAVECGLPASSCGSGYRSTAHNGMIIEQAQILTTHNLATLVACHGVKPGAAGWCGLARRSAQEVCRMTAAARAAHGIAAGRWAKRAAFAWRQMVFYMAMEEDAEARAAVGQVFEGCRDEGVKRALRKHVLRLTFAMRASEEEWGSLSQALEGPLLGWSPGRRHCLCGDGALGDAHSPGGALRLLSKCFPSFK